MRDFAFNTPVTIHETSVSEQAEKVIEECYEVIDAVKEEQGYLRVLEEAMDAYFAVEKLLRDHFTYTEVSMMRQYVETKNTRRPSEPGSSVNYYGDAL